MISFPNSKINIGLNILGKRADGYHDLETIFYPLPFYDALEIIHANTALSVSSCRLSVSGELSDTNVEENLCTKVFELLKKEFPSIPSVIMHLHKQIPVGAGLGGGSADAAFTLRTLNNLFVLNCSEIKLSALAVQLGSDCPFFIVNKPCLAWGRGEILAPVEVDLSSYKIVLVNPGISVNTTDMFRQIKPKKQNYPLEHSIHLPVEKWKEQISNDFEEIVFAIYPTIGKLKSDLYDAGAIYASLSGSGSSVYGIFKKDQRLDLHFPPEYIYRIFLLR